jgi:hypothetical protein
VTEVERVKLTRLGRMDDSDVSTGYNNKKSHNYRLCRYHQYIIHNKNPNTEIFAGRFIIDDFADALSGDEYFLRKFCKSANVLGVPVLFVLYLSHLQV